MLTYYTVHTLIGLGKVGKNQKRIHIAYCTYTISTYIHTYIHKNHLYIFLLHNAAYIHSYINSDVKANIHTNRQLNIIAPMSPW